MSAHTLALSAREGAIASHPLFPRLVKAVGGHESPQRFTRLRKTWCALIPDEYGNLHDWGIGGPRWARYGRQSLVDDRAVRLSIRIVDDLWPTEDGDPTRRVGRYDDRAAQAYVLARGYARARRSGR